jgi:type I restriction enzyme S subunit
MSRLADLGEIVTGSTPKTSESIFFNGSMPFVTPSELGSSTPITVTPRSLSELGTRQVRPIPPGAVLVCCIGSLGKVGIAGVSVATNQQINAILFNEQRVLARYGYHACRLLGPALEKAASSTTVPIVNKTSFGRLEIPVPPLVEQRRITAILDQADALRAKRRQTLTQLDEMARAIFVEMFGDPTSPKPGTRIKPLKDLTTKIGSGATPSGGEASYKSQGVALIRSMNVRDGFFSWRDLARLHDEQAQKLDNVEVESNDVLLNITGASVARVCRAPAEVIPARVNQHVSIIRLTSQIRPEYLEHCFLHPTYKAQLLKIAEAGATRQAITKAQIETLLVPIPTICKQDQFVMALRQVSRVRDAAILALKDLDALFASLQHRAFRGEL